MKKALVLIAAAAMMLVAAPSVSAANAEQNPQKTVKKAAKKSTTETRVVKFQTSIHCKNCGAKVQDNVSFEKGVKDLQVAVAEKVVTITYDPSKTSVEKLAAAINKLGYTATVISDEKVEK